MRDMRVLRIRIGTMPTDAELALAYALQARRLRHASRCTCGSGKAGPNCTTNDTERHGAAILAIHAENARKLMNEYRKARTWKYSGSRGAS